MYVFTCVCVRRMYTQESVSCHIIVLYRLNPYLKIVGSQTRSGVLFRTESWTVVDIHFLSKILCMYHKILIKDKL